MRGALVPFFAGRIDHILPAQQANDFKKFYVDTAILGNPAALGLTIKYYGIDHVLFGTDAPFGIAPAGASCEIGAAIAELGLSVKNLEKIYKDNYYNLLIK